MDKSKFGDYLSSDDLGDCTDGDAKNAEWIHACSWERSADGKKKRPKKSGQLFLREIPCQSGRTFEVCQIRPSAMYFDRERLAELAKQGVATSGTEDKNIGVMKNDGGQYYRVCYSSHSSLTELMEFVRHFKPQKIVPCVQPRGMTLDQVRNPTLRAERISERALTTYLLFVVGTRSFGLCPGGRPGARARLACSECPTRER